ncbi:hypothetical protein A2W54_04710 [Candidatus Giovannonibacteria bacterium RIFCSPHIGHO2_02_43_13]|uniref:Uncharacterized protein n=1 Tax=Candidatus Giovannonibacteria bacterium RIFCSPHIGHO2_02_43_13 TaxID=1798330 RepID=A0A1F5WS92_9BACT|nr:MAG: hypothetical protein A3E06_01660 [Candidatus Giovannonibacteria bacterium RIFCSPHIGHO2_12_FULL_44_42]OGF78467.1 MAG: hypothetical protein A2W54_04710 [Candidatus Giovannonibacteria bacterium RIFCSPHIGHO2_02_43_13]OGF88632.1 MAG: hypothetical protein A3I94_03940 [Candidatus Giovannonibacteria bacterium RIFCSPLOWO2_02_FULL_43_54]OGF97548.1 MAG: hypothetical protein A3H08_00390 [Candidatus Giovannonibacteria bacterium RIFCSPLOWO2_12_FULL_44_32]
MIQVCLLLHNSSSFGWKISHITQKPKCHKETYYNKNNCKNIKFISNKKLIHKIFLFPKIWFEPMFFSRFFGSFKNQSVAAEFFAPSFRGEAAKCVRTIFKIAHQLGKDKSGEVASPRSATKSYGVLAENLNWRFSGEKKIFSLLIN